jgi:hypothetical protein
VVENPPKNPYNKKKYMSSNVILTIEDARYVAKCFKDYYLRFESIQDYQYECLKYRDFVPSLFGDNEEIFDAFDMSPENMNFKIHSVDTMDQGKDKFHQLFSNLLELTGSNQIERSIPGRKLRWLIEETTTGKYVGMIRMGSPTTYSKPRNDMLGKVAELKHLNHRMVMGFNIVPTQPFGYNYLGGKLLSLLCCSHEMKRQFDEKYGTDLAFFETTSLYGSSKASSQYDGLKPYIKYIGLSISDLVPLIQGELYDHLCDFFKVRNNNEHLVPLTASSRKRKMQTKWVAEVKKAMKDFPDEKQDFMNTITYAKNLTERKRTFSCNYGFLNSKEVLLGEQDTLIPNPDNYHKYELNNLIEYWRKKATKRWEKLKEEGRLRTTVETWDGSSDIDMIR